MFSGWSCHYFMSLSGLSVKGSERRKVLLLQIQNISHWRTSQNQSSRAHCCLLLEAAFLLHLKRRFRVEEDWDLQEQYLLLFISDKGAEQLPPPPTPSCCWVVFYISFFLILIRCRFQRMTFPPATWFHLSSRRISAAGPLQRIFLVLILTAANTCWKLRVLPERPIYGVWNCWWSRTGGRHRGSSWHPELWCQ